MSVLESLSCEACDKNAIRLSPNEVVSLLSELAGWQVIVDESIENKAQGEVNGKIKGKPQKLVRVIPTKNFKKSMALSQEIADLAETVNHHPLIIVEYSSVTVQWWTHVIEGLHKNDFIMAHKTSQLIERD